MKLLLGVGGSEDSFMALDRTLERVEETGDDLTVAILANPESDLSTEDLYDRVKERLETSPVQAPVRRVAGDPGSRLVEIAEAEDFDAIAVGGGQRSPMGKITTGQIAEFVILNAPVTVILVR